MNLANYTIKAQQTIAAAQQLAFNNNNPSIETEHLLQAILEDKDSTVSFLLKKNNVNPVFLDSKLIEQINKDFNLANEGIDLPLSLLPNEIKLQLHEKIYRLIQYKFAEYLNLLYIIDVSEDQIKKLDGSDVFKLSEDVTFLILKREWQKVWFRNKY